MTRHLFAERIIPPELLLKTARLKGEGFRPYLQTIKYPSDGVFLFIVFCNYRSGNFLFFAVIGFLAVLG